MGVLVLVRFGVSLLRLSLGPNSWLRAWETRLTLVHLGRGRVQAVRLVRGLSEHARTAFD